MVKFLKLDQLDELVPDATEHGISRRDVAMAMYKSKFEHNTSTSDAFADSNAVHLASESVMDGMYGSERGNEIFIAYPSAYVASQLHYGGDSTLDRGGADARNDKLIYTKDHQGMPLDAGLVFIPEDAQIDPKTGSRYKMDEHGAPIVPTQRTNEVLAARFEKSGFVQAFVQRLPFQMDSAQKEDKVAFAEAAFNKFGITDPEAQKALLDPIFINELADIWGTEGENGKYEEKLTKYFHENAENPYELAEETVPSHEYWEKYFKENPGERPSKIVYYSGGDPSRALNKWREKNKITKRTKDPTYGFPDNKVEASSEKANFVKDRFSSLALRVIDDRFPEVPNPEEVES